MAGTLILVRHGQSEWNLKNLFTGWRNPELTAQGIAEAKATGIKLKAAGLTPTVFYTSALRRAQHTLDLILEQLGIVNVVITRNQALNERDYGDLSGLNKDDARAKWGEEQVHVWRRSYDVPPPGGESLKDTAARIVASSEAPLATPTPTPASADAAVPADAKINADDLKRSNVLELPFVYWLATLLHVAAVAVPSVDIVAAVFNFSAELYVAGYTIRPPGVLASNDVST